MATVDQADRQGWHQAVAALAPSAEAIATRRRPRSFDGPDEWSRYRCYRGLACGGLNGLVTIGLALSHQPLDEAIVVGFETATFDIEAAKKFAARLQRAIAAAEAAT